MQESDNYLGGFEFGLHKQCNVLNGVDDRIQVELQQLRTENRLLRERIDSLEKETTMLADRLVQDQVKYAETIEELRCVALRREVSSIDNGPLNEKGEVMMRETDDILAQAIEKYKSHIVELERSLTEAQQREVQGNSTIQELRMKIHELESSIAEDQDCDLLSLQDALIASKLREAEGNMSTKELQQKVCELQRHWQRHMEASAVPDKKSKISKTKLQETTEELMTSRIREANLSAELTEMKQTLMELETTNHIYERQVKRLSADNEKLKERHRELETNEINLTSGVNDLQRRFNNLETKIQEEEMMSRIREAEYSQSVAEMKQKIAELEIQNQELLTREQLNNSEQHLGNFSENQNVETRILELKQELTRLRLTNLMNRTASTISLASCDTDFSDDDYTLHIDTTEKTIDGTLPAGSPSNTSLPISTGGNSCESVPQCYPAENINGKTNRSTIEVLTDNSFDNASFSTQSWPINRDILDNMDETIPNDLNSTLTADSIARCAEKSNMNENLDTAADVEVSLIFSATSNEGSNDEIVDAHLRENDGIFLAFNDDLSMCHTSDMLTAKDRSSAGDQLADCRVLYHDVESRLKGFCATNDEPDELIDDVFDGENRLDERGHVNLMLNNNPNYDLASDFEVTIKSTGNHIVDSCDVIGPCIDQSNADSISVACEELESVDA